MTLSRWSKLINHINNFYKLAGILEVPDNLLNEAVSWAKSVYCSKIKKICESYMTELSNREEDQLALDALKEQLENLRYIFEGNLSPSDLFKEIKGDNDISIPFFSMEKNKELKYPFNVINGEYNINRPEALRISINDIGLDQYNFTLIINNKEDRQYIKDNKISKDKILSYLDNNMDMIFKVYWDFLDFYISFQENTDQVGFLKSKYTEIIEYCNIYINEKYTETKYKLVLDLTKSKYFSNKEMEDFKWPYFRIAFYLYFIFSYEEAKAMYGGEKWAGIWTGDLYLANELLENDELKIDNLKKVLNQISKTTRHELQHAMQTYIGKIKNLKHEGGLPKKKSLQKGVNIDGINIITTDQDTYLKEKLPHELRDIEFQPRISDTISYYKNIISEVDPKFRTLYFKAWVAAIPLETFIDQYIDDFKIKLKEKFDKSNSSTSLLDESLYVRIKGKTNKYIWDNGLYYKYEIMSPLENANDFFTKLKTNMPKYEQAVKLVYAALSKEGLV